MNRGDVDNREQDLRTLVERAQRSDPDAWETLYRLSYARLFQYARRLGTREEADDVVSEAFARAYEAIGRFRWRDGGANAWLFGIAAT
ncbi:MAG: hypothetical protein H0U16_00030 [Actinobacteria bacterium]|nr:hypothetical protein [Actinomycetota bacterium]